MGITLHWFVLAGARRGTMPIHKLSTTPTDCKVITFHLGQACEDNGPRGEESCTGNGDAQCTAQ